MKFTIDGMSGNTDGTYFGVQRVLIDASLKDLVTKESTPAPNEVHIDARVQFTSTGSDLKVGRMDLGKSASSMFQNKFTAPIEVSPFSVRVGPGVEVYFEEDDGSLTEVI